jgi:hypothetical protein
MYLKFQHDKHETDCAYVLFYALEIAQTRLLPSVILKKISGAIPPDPSGRGTLSEPFPRPPTKVAFPLLSVYEMTTGVEYIVWPQYWITWRCAY